jgi:hypothetical protein
MKIKCDICKKRLKKKGALLFSPPKHRKVEKIHICRKCYKKINRYLGR